MSPNWNFRLCWPLPAELSLADLDLSGGSVPVALALGRALFVWALDPIMLTRPDTGQILDANPEACRTLGLTVEHNALAAYRLKRAGRGASCDARAVG